MPAVTRTRPSPLGLSQFDFFIISKNKCHSEYNMKRLLSEKSRFKIVGAVFSHFHNAFHGQSLRTRSLVATLLSGKLSGSQCLQTSFPLSVEAEGTVGFPRCPLQVHYASIRPRISTGAPLEPNACALSASRDQVEQGVRSVLLGLRGRHREVCRNTHPRVSPGILRLQSTTTVPTPK